MRWARAETLMMRCRRRMPGGTRPGAVGAHLGGAQLGRQAVEHAVDVLVAVGAAEVLGQLDASLSTTRQGTSGQFWNS
jgi:hypothetical protein